VADALLARRPHIAAVVHRPMAVARHGQVGLVHRRTRAIEIGIPRNCVLQRARAITSRVMDQSAGVIARPRTGGA
jgi:hypothetical protein